MNQSSNFPRILRSSKIFVLSLKFSDLDIYIFPMFQRTLFICRQQSLNSCRRDQSYHGIWFVNGIWLERKQSQIGYFSPKRPIFFHASATYSELPSNISMNHISIKIRYICLYLAVHPQRKNYFFPWYD